MGGEGRIRTGWRERISPYTGIETYRDKRSGWGAIGEWLGYLKRVGGDVISCSRGWIWTQNIGIRPHTEIATYRDKRSGWRVISER